MNFPEDGRRRVVIEGVSPLVDCGRFPAKRVAGDRVVVEADIFTDGHDAISARLLCRHESGSDWHIEPMQPLLNDRWRAAFIASELGFYRFTIEAWVDHFKSWHRDLRKRIDAGQNVDVQFLVGAQLIEAAAKRATKNDRDLLSDRAKLLLSDAGRDEKIEAIFSNRLVEAMERNPDFSFATRYELEPRIEVDRKRAAFSTWYEMFPRSTEAKSSEHGTFATAEQRLPKIAGMGFDVLYLPPIHPIGTTNRKGKNNALETVQSDVGSPWAIGAKAGGHKSIHPQLGTIEDFRRFAAKASELGLELALDIAFQASPDHPLVAEHPEFFRTLPDGTVQYAENPPKNYQDIYPFDFETGAWRELWEELRGVFTCWIGEGIRIFRVDNPHTKPLPFWQWVIRSIRDEHPDVIFLAEAFTRPKIMYWLAKAGFTQSYMYFAWRNTKWELTDYFTELTRKAPREFFRPNAWPNTPDILTEFLQYGGRPAFMLRYVLAATLSANCGIYGPAYELLDHEAREFGSEEYRDSEKYEIRSWNTERGDSLAPFITRVNRIRLDNEALHANDSLHFHEVDNDQMICYSKTSPDGTNVIVVVANLDPWSTQAGNITLDLDALDIDASQPCQLHDLLSGARFSWSGGRNRLELNPHVVPAMIFTVRRRIRSERDFDYFL